MWRSGCRKFLILWLLVLWFACVNAQDHPVVHGFWPGDYQAAPQNWSIDTTSLGIVVGNSDGLLEFDGEHWQVNSIPGNHRIRAVAEVNDTVFCGGYGEFGFWVSDAGGMRHYESLSADIQYQLTSEEEIWHILPYPGGVLFQSFSTIYLYEQDSVRILTPPFSSGIMYTYFCQGELLLQVIGEGLARLLPETGRFELIPSGDILSEATVIGMVNVRDGALIATDRNGLFLYDGKEIHPIMNQLRESLSRHQLNKITTSGDQLILGTILDGVYVVDSEGNIREHINQETGLPDNTILSLCDAGQGRIWIGMDHGLAFVNLHSPYRRFFDQNGELGVVFAATEFQEKLYLGTNHGLFEVAGPQLETGNIRLIEGTQGQVWSLKTIGEKLYCGHNDGTFLIEGMAGRQVCDITGAWDWLPLPDSGNWIQGTYTGLVSVKSDQNGSLRFSRIPGLAHPIRNLVRDKQGRIWGVAPYRGIFRVQLSETADSVVQEAHNLPEWGLPDLNRLYMVRIGEHILVRSDSGWFQLNDSGEQFFRIESIGNLQLSREIIRLEEMGEYLLGVRPDGLLIQAARQVRSLETGRMPEFPAFYGLDNGMVLSGISQGFLVIDPDAIKPSRMGPIRITGVTVFGDDGPASYPTQEPKGMLTIVMQPRDQGVNLMFTSGFQESDQYYRYRLGEKSEWSPWQEEASISYPLLPYGESQISIQRKADGQTLRIVCDREYPWYMKDWAVLLFVVTGLIGIYISLQRYQIALERRWKKQQIEEARARHAREVEARNRQLVHEVEEQNQELAGITMNLVRKNEIILELRDDLKKLQRKDDSASRQELRSLVLKLNSELSSEKDWEAFEYHFTRVHQGFFKGLKEEYPTLTSGDMRLAAYIRMNLSSKEIAPLLHISVRSVENKRYRLRRKLDLQADQQIIDILLKY